MSTTQELVLANLGLVPAAAKPFLRQGMSPEHREDLIAAGRLGLVEAAASYDPDKGRFSQWAWTHIRSRLIDEVRITSYPMLTGNAFNQRHRIATHTARHPEASTQDTAAELGISASLVEQISGYQRPISYDAPTPNGSSWYDALDGGETALEDSVVYKLDSCHLNSVVRRAVERLPELQRDSVKSYFGLGGDPVDWASMAEESGLSRETTRTRGMRGLRNLAKDPELLAALA